MELLGLRDDQRMMAVQPTGLHVAWSAGLEVGRIQPMGSFDLTSPALRALIQARAARKVDRNEPVVAPSSLLGDEDVSVVFSDDPAIAVGSRSGPAGLFL